MTFYNAIGNMDTNTLLNKFFFTLQYDGEFQDWAEMIEHSDEAGNITPHEHLGLMIMAKKPVVLRYKDGCWEASIFNAKNLNDIKVIEVTEYAPLNALLRAYLESRWGLVMPTPLELMETTK